MVIRILLSTKEVFKCSSAIFNDVLSRIVPEYMEVPFNNKFTAFAAWNYFVSLYKYSLVIRVMVCNLSSPTKRPLVPRHYRI